MAKPMLTADERYAKLVELAHVNHGTRLLTLARTPDSKDKRRAIRELAEHFERAADELRGIADDMLTEEKRGGERGGGDMICRCGADIPCCERTLVGVETFEGLLYAIVFQCPNCRTTRYAVMWEPDDHEQLIADTAPIFSAARDQREPEEDDRDAA